MFVVTSTFIMGLKVHIHAGANAHCAKLCRLCMPMMHRQNSKMCRGLNCAPPDAL